MSDLKPVTMYCCKGCQHLHHEIVTACDCGTGCDPFEYEIWEARRRTQPEAAPAAPTDALKEYSQRDLLMMHDLSRKLLWLAYVWNDHNFGAAHLEARRVAEAWGIKSFDDANRYLEKFTAPAQDLSATDRADALRWRAFAKALITRIPGPGHGTKIKVVEVCPMYGEEKEVSNITMLIDHAILQSQKGDKE